MIVAELVPLGGSARARQPARQTDERTFSLSDSKLTHRPSARQLQGQRADDGALQVIAAAMLPLVWPSYQLSEPNKQLPGWQLNYRQLTRTNASAAAAATTTTTSTTTRAPAIVGAQAAASDFATTIVSAEQTPTRVPWTAKRAKEPLSSSKDGQRTTRKRRRKPSYLAKVSTSTGGYPDSTRMASRYQLPRIKFAATTAAGQLQTTSTATTSAWTPIAPTSAATRAPTATPRRPQVPESLHRLIERQLLANATSLLQRHKSLSATNASTAHAPTTSVSKIVRLAADQPRPTELRRTASPTAAPTTSAPPTPTTLAPTATPTTTTAAPTTTTTTITTPTKAATTTQTKTTTAASETSNRLLPEEEAGERKQPERHKLTGNSKRNANQLSKQHSGVKLFHFKRKPDTSKLPFFRRPLNYTELGWSAEQIADYQAAVQLDPSAPANATEELPAEGQPPTSPPGADQPWLEPRRKRRGKNQFERLMAELHGEQSESSVGAVGAVGAEPEEPTSGDEQRVPVLRKKVESWVMRPMFPLMNQKRRGGQPTTPLADASPTTTTTAAPDELAASRAASKPIIRMRRKHHGDLPGALEASAAAWRPSKPVWSAPLVSSAQTGVMLVPSALLTPSGSQLVPLFASSADQQPAWRPSQPSLPSLPSLPSSPSLSSLSSQTSQPNRLESNQVGELRVPKLLVKPARPAKYSLNGYIPKPSLASNSSPAVQVQQNPAQPQPQPQLLAHQTNSQLRSRTKSSLDLVSKDSSTSNEIISHRRGLQLQLQQQLLQAQQTPAKGAQSSPAVQFNSLLGSPAGKSVDKSADKLRQMEAKKRKYVEQQQPLRLPAISAQRANLIKAKLGLPISSAAASARSARSAAAQQATNTQVLFADPPVAAEEEQQQQQQPAVASAIIGAPLSSIPKTDFECTDKRGRFVAGLFADTQTGCQVWHLCSNNRKYSFLCPTGTIFNAKLRICDWRYNAKCANSTASNTPN